MGKSMLAGDPVPGVELFLEEEPDDEPIAHGTTDASGVCRLPLPAGNIGIKLLLPRAASTGASSVLFRIRDEGVIPSSRALAVPFDRSGPAPLEWSISSEERREAAIFEVLVLDPRSPVEQALLTGLFQRELQSAACLPLIHELSAALSELLGAPSEVIDGAQGSPWPPPIGVQRTLVYVVETPAGQMQISIQAQVSLIQGKPVLSAGGKTASKTAEARALGTALHESILKSLGELRGLAKGIQIVLLPPEMTTRGTNSKGGFAVGGYSQT